MLEFGGLRSEGEFEVFDSGASWEFLFGKLLLHCFKVLHDFNVDTITIQSAQKSVVLCNDHGVLSSGGTPMGESPTYNVKDQGNSVGGSSSMNPPPRQVLYMDIQELPVQNDEHGFIADCIDIITREVDEDATRTGENIMEKEEHNAEERLEKNEEQPGDELGTNQGGGDVLPLREVPSHEFMLEEAKETEVFIFPRLFHMESME